MAASAKAVILVPRARVDVDADGRKGTRQRFCGDSNSIRKFGDLIELDRVLKDAGSVSSAWNCIFPGIPCEVDPPLSRRFCRAFAGSLGVVESFL